MSVGQKLAMFKIRYNALTILSLCNLEAAPEEAMQLRRLRDHICLGKLTLIEIL